MSDTSIKGPTNVPQQTGTSEVTTSTEQAQTVQRAETDAAHATPHVTKISSKTPLAAEFTVEISPTVSTNAVNLLSTLANRKSKPADVLAAMANLTPSNSDPKISQHIVQENKAQLRRELAKLSPAQRTQLAKKLDSESLQALRRAAGEGVGLIPVKDRNLTTQMLKVTTQNIDLLHDALGITGKPKNPSSKALKKAQVEVGKLVKNFDANLVRYNGKVPAEKMANLQKLIYSSDGQAEVYKVGNVCEDFNKDVRTSFVILENAVGERSWLNPNYLEGLDTGKLRAYSSAKNLNEFAGGDKEKAMVLSQLMTKAVSDAVSLETLHEDAGINMTMSDGRSVVEAEGNDRHVFLLKANEDGSHTLKVSTERQIEKITTSAEERVSYEETRPLVPYDGRLEEIDHGETPPMYQDAKVVNCNAGQSTFATQMTLNIAMDNKVDLAEVEYKLSVTTDVSTEGSTSGISGLGRTAELEMIGTRFGIPPENDLHTLGANMGKARQLGGSDSHLAELSAYFADLRDSGSLDNDQVKVLETRIEFLEDARVQLERLDSVSEADAEGYLEQMTNLLSDMKLIQQDLGMRAALWAGYADPANAGNIATAIAGLSTAYSGTVDQIQELATDTQAALDELRGNLDDVCTSALDARANFARMQSQANASVYGAIANKAMDLARTMPGLSDDVSPLCAEIVSRAANIEAKLDDYESGGPLPEFGPGAKGKQLKNLTKQLEAALNKGEALPASHPQLNEAQLVEIRVNHFLNKNSTSQFAEFLNNRAANFKRAMVKEISNGDWNPVVKTFHDVDAQGKICTFVSTIVPASSMSVPQFNYEGGIPPSNRTQGTHANNLAHSTLTNAQGELLFAGLRHGIMDAAAITPKFLIEQATDAEVEALIHDPLSKDGRWLEQIQGTEDENNIARQVSLLRKPEYAEQMAGWIRSGANINAGLELVAAAVNNDPALQEAGLSSGEPVTLNLNSLSLVTPSSLLSGNKSELTMQRNQEVALRSIAEIGPFPVQVFAKDGTPKSIMVDVSYQPFNFAVNGFGVGTSAVQRLIKPAVNWNQMDEQNSRSLVALLGELKSTEIGGEAGRVLAHLDNREPDRPLSQAQKLALSADGPINSAFADPAKRASAIRTLGAQIKEIFNHGDHRKAGNEPYKIVSRLALFSHLLGDTVSYNCRSGKDRTSQLDAEVKMLASSLADGNGTNAPKPNTVADRVRKTNYLLNTGQLEMQEKNTGLRGFKLRIPTSKTQGRTISVAEMNSLGKQFNSRAARVLYNGDSRFVSS